MCGLAPALCDLLKGDRACSKPLPELLFVALLEDRLLRKVGQTVLSNGLQAAVRSERRRDLGSTHAVCLFAQHAHAVSVGPMQGITDVHNPIANGSAVHT